MGFEAKLKDLTIKIGSGSTPRGGQDSYLKNGETHLIRSQNIYNHQFKWEGIAFISEEQAEKLKNVIVEENDILINITGDSVARNMIATTEFLPARVNQHVSIIRCDQEKLDPYYLSAILTSEEMQRQLLSLGQTGGTRAALTKTMLENLEIPIFDIQKQRSIGQVLNMYNSKIENNNKIIENLEQFAQTLFKRWFVDFEFPNEDGEPYKSSGGEMVDSELGRVPKNWSIEELKNIAKQVGSIVKVQELDKVLLHIGLAHMPRGSIALSEWETSEEITSNKTSFEKNDILFGKLRPYFKKVGIAPLKGICSTDIIVLNAIEQRYYAYLISLVSCDTFIDYCTATATGTRMPRTGWRQMSKYKIVKPPNEIANKFNDLLVPFYEEILTVIHENTNLQKLRDTLLPKLLSGEIELPDENEVIT